MACNGHAVLVNQVHLVQFGHDSGYAAGIVQVDHIVVTGRRKLAQVGALAAYFVKNIQPKVKPGFAKNSGQMQHRIGGAAQRHIHGNGIGHSLGGNNIQRPDAAFKQVHNAHARCLGQANARPAHGRNGAIAGQGHTYGFCQTIHGVGGKHTRTCATAGAGAFGHVFQFFFTHGPAAHLAHGLKDRNKVTALARADIAGQHGPARNHNRRNIEAHHGHQHAGYAFIAVGDENQGVKSVGARHNFYRVGNKFARGQRKTHAFMVHGQAIANGYGRKLQGRAARHAHSGFYRIGQSIKMQMPRHNLTGCVDHTYQRAVHFFPGQAQGVKQGTVRGFFKAGLHFFAAALIHDGILTL